MGCSPPTDIESDVASFALSFSLDDVPEPTREKAKLVLMDTVGVCVRGSTADYVVDATKSFARFTGDSGASTVFATRSTGAPLLAAESNAAGGTTLELDEGNQRSAHMGIHTVPPALAISESIGASGADLLEAIVVAYEVGARLGNVVRPLTEGLHPHGAWAPVAGAVATAHLLDFDETTYREAIRMAVNPFVVGHWAACLEGATVRNFYSGISSAHGMKAALLAESGVTGVEDAMYRCLLPYVTDREIGRETLVEQYGTLGDEYYLEDSYFKIHAACRYVHAPVEALEQILDEHDIDAADVERIVVRTFTAGTKLSNRHPSNVLGAKFSTPYVLAARLLFGRSGVDAFSPELVDRDDVQALAGRIDIERDERYDERAEAGRWGAEVEVRTTDGDSIVDGVEDARGGGENPFTEAEIVQKFDDLVVDVTSQETANQLADSLVRIDERENVSDLFAPLRERSV